MSSFSALNASNAAPFFQPIQIQISQPIAAPNPIAQEILGNLGNVLPNAASLSAHLSHQLMISYLETRFAFLRGQVTNTISSLETINRQAQQLRAQQLQAQQLQAQQLQAQQLRAQQLRAQQLQAQQLQAQQLPRPFCQLQNPQILNARVLATFDLLPTDAHPEAAETKSRFRLPDEGNANPIFIKKKYLEKLQIIVGESFFIRIKRTLQKHSRQNYTKLEGVTSKLFADMLLEKGEKHITDNWERICTIIKRILKAGGRNEFYVGRYLNALRVHFDQLKKNNNNA